MKFAQEKKIQLGVKIIDLANMILAGLVIGQAFIDKPFNPLFAIVGGVVFLSLWSFGMWVMKERG